MLLMSSRIVRNEDLLATEVDGETIMMDAESGQYFTLNGIASRIWQDLAQPVNVAELCRRLEDEYDATADVIQESVLRFLKQMLEKKLIRVDA